MASAIVLNLLRTRPDVWFEVALPHQPPSESPASPKRGFRFACGRLSKIGSATIPDPDASTSHPETALLLQLLLACSGRHIGLTDWQL